MFGIFIATLIAIILVPFALQHLLKINLRMAWCAYVSIIFVLLIVLPFVLLYIKAPEHIFAVIMIGIAVFAPDQVFTTKEERDDLTHKPLKTKDFLVIAAALILLFALLYGTAKLPENIKHFVLIYVIPLMLAFLAIRYTTESYKRIKHLEMQRHKEHQHPES